MNNIDELVKEIEMNYGEHSVFIIYNNTIVLLPTLSHLILRYPPINEQITSVFNDIETEYNVIEITEFCKRIVNIDVPTILGCYIDVKYISDEDVYQKLKNILDLLTSKNYAAITSLSNDIIMELISNIYRIDNPADRQLKYNRDILYKIVEYSYYLENNAFFLTETQKNLLEELKETSIDLKMAKEIIIKCKSKIPEIPLTEALFDGDSMLNARQDLNTLTIELVLKNNKERTILALI